MGGRACVDSVENTTKMRKTLRQLRGDGKAAKHRRLETTECDKTLGKGGWRRWKNDGVRV